MKKKTINKKIYHIFILEFSSLFFNLTVFYTRIEKSQFPIFKINEYHTHIYICINNYKVVEYLKC